MCLGVLFVCIAFWYIEKDDPDRGTFGDMFGAVNALFSSLAFATLIYTIWLQRHELSLQRKELALTRKELRGQREQMETQNATLLVQRFEDTFFQLLRVHNEIIGAMDLIGRRDNVTRSRDCFKVFFERFKKDFEDRPFEGNTRHDLAAAQEAYVGFYEAHQHELGHYFRHLYHIVKFVKTSHIDEKQRYVSLVRAQLSSYELALLFYNCLSEHGRDKFKPLVDEFALFKNLPPRLLLRESHPSAYAPSAFGTKLHRFSNGST
jgi:hypothetical protein